MQENTGKCRKTRENAEKIQENAGKHKKMQENTVKKKGKMWIKGEIHIPIGLAFDN